MRIPLFQAAFHDAVVTTHHWSNGHFKYPDLVDRIELFELLWMCPPMVHLNYTTLEDRRPKLKEHTSRWSPVHKRLGFSALTGFRYLTEDKLVQETTWEDGTRIIVNFGEKEYRLDGKLLGPGRMHVY